MNLDVVSAQRILDEWHKAYPNLSKLHDDISKNYPHMLKSPKDNHGTKQGEDA
jgi:hypothetical protein